VSHSITRRLLFSHLIILAAFLGLAAAALDRAFRTSTESAVRERLQAHVYTLLTAAQPDAYGRMRLPEVLGAPDFNQPDSGLYAEVEGESGNYRWRSGSLIGRGRRLATPSRPGETRFHFGHELAVLDQGIAWEDDNGDAIAYWLTVALDNSALQAELSGFRSTLWRWLGGVTLLLLGSQVLLARWGLAPLRQMSAAVRKIENGQKARIEGPVPLELRGLSDNLNALIEQNRQRQERVRNSLADLAHSMKTPLAVLRGAGEQSHDPKLRELLDEQTQRIDDIVSYQRQRAAVAGTGGMTRPIAITPILQRLCSSLDKVHLERGIRCSMQVDEQLMLRADQGDLFELFGNLLENAYKHCRGRVRVGASIDRGKVRVDFEDDGEGIPDGGIDRILQRGERADRRHPGEGLGLAVVSEIVRQYRGELSIGRSELGGARASVTLPA
jgi:two-component system sensor histidine kinase PhoQ